jgi:ABC-type cobalamin transport system ATPase subunit
VLLDQGDVAAECSTPDVLRPEVHSRVYGVPMRRVELEGGRVVVVPEV